MHTNSALSFSVTFTAIEGGPKEDIEGIAVKRKDQLKNMCIRNIKINK